MFKIVAKIILIPRQMNFSLKRKFAFSRTLYSSTVKSLEITKRAHTRKKKAHEDTLKQGYFRAVAYSTAEEYDLDDLALKFMKKDMFKITVLPKELKNPNFLHSFILQEATEKEQQEIFIFKEGALVTWNVSDLDVEVLLALLTKHQTNNYPEDIIREEGEVMNYAYSSTGEKTRILDDDILLAPQEGNNLDKYAVSNAMALSVKLGTWEATLARYIDSMSDITDDLKLGNRIKMSQAEVMRKTGELFSLRHSINLRSDLLDTPDLYWDREDLEKVYTQTASYFCIGKRTRVINEKINHCIELVELLSSHLRDNHHVRLEWMIIILIMVEVFFEILRHIEENKRTEEHNEI